MQYIYIYTYLYLYLYTHIIISIYVLSFLKFHWHTIIYLTTKPLREPHKIPCMDISLSHADRYTPPRKKLHARYRIGQLHPFAVVSWVSREHEACVQRGVAHASRACVRSIWGA